MNGIGLREFDRTVKNTPEIKKFNCMTKMISTFSMLCFIVSILALMYLSQPDEFYSHTINILWGGSLFLYVILRGVVVSRKRQLVLMVEDEVASNKDSHVESHQDNAG